MISQTRKKLIAQTETIHIFANIPTKFDIKIIILNRKEYSALHMY